MKVEFCDKCGKEITGGKFTLSVGFTEGKTRRLLFCFSCKKVMEGEIEKILPEEPELKFREDKKPHHSIDDGDGENIWGTNHSTDRWGGAGPDCLPGLEGVQPQKSPFDK